MSLEQNMPNVGLEDGDDQVESVGDHDQRPGQLPVRPELPEGGDSMNSFLEIFTDLLKCKIQNELSHQLSAMAMPTTSGWSGSSSSSGSQSTSSTHGSAAKVQAPKNFMLNQNFRIWLERFETYAQLARIPLSERKQQLLSRLDHQSYVAVANLNLPSYLDYSEFKTALTSRFHNVTREDYKLQLRAKTQSSSETYETYADGLQELALNAFPNSGFELQQEMAMDQFLLGVMVAEPLKQQLLMSAPKKMAEAIRKVRQLEAAQLMLRQGAPSSTSSKHERPRIASVANQPAAVVAATSPQTSQSSEMGKVLKLLEKMESRITQLERLKSSDSAAKECWRCHGNGHGPHQCPTLECYHCHGSGHISRFCPQKSGNSNMGLSRGGQSH
jgi:hypothetical protein